MGRVMRTSYPVTKKRDTILRYTASSQQFFLPNLWVCYWNKNFKNYLCWRVGNCSRFI